MALHRTLIRSLLCGAALCLSSASAQDSGHAPDRVTLAEQYLLAAANQEREARGLAPLRRHPQLARVAAEHARAMAEHQSISHQFQGELPLSTRGAVAGVPFSLISENVGQAPSILTIHDMWMHSEHHRTNLLDPAIDSAGISVIERQGEFYAVEDFARIVRKVGIEEQESAIASLVAAQGVRMASGDSQLLAAARRTCTLSSGYAGERRPTFIMRFTTDSLNRLPEQLLSRLQSSQYHEAEVGACEATDSGPFTSYSFAVLLYR